VDVISTPEAPQGEDLIDGPNNVCVDSNTVYCSNAVADTYLWEITGDGTIVGPNDANCVTVSVGATTGGFLLTLTVCNIADTNDCCNSSELEVAIEECGGTYCTFTQGAWGNAGGKACGGKTTTELINQALTAAGGSIVVGVLGERSITFDDANSILLRLPAGGKPGALPVGLNVNASNQAALEAAKLVKKKGDAINNVLVGQVVALTLNLLVSDGCVEDSEVLANLELLAEFCTVPYGEEEACAELSIIPESLVGMDVGDLLDAANAALAGDDAFSISDIYKAVTAINEGFDECRTIVPCNRPEICGNGCDDDGDGDTDCEDSDCSGDPACAI